MLLLSWYPPKVICFPNSNNFVRIHIVVKSGEKRLLRIVLYFEIRKPRTEHIRCIYQHICIFIWKCFCVDKLYFFDNFPFKITGRAVGREWLETDWKSTFASAHCNWVSGNFRRMDISAKQFIGERVYIYINRNIGISTNPSYVYKY